MNSQFAELVEEVASDYRVRVRTLPVWDDVVDFCARLKLSSEIVDGAVAAGLMVDSVEMMTQDHWPHDVVAALKHLGLYKRYSPETFHGVLAHLSQPQLRGLGSSVKGTDFEIQSTHLINHGDMTGLPGHVAHVDLATTTNQAGWDAVGTTDHGTTVHLQMKATDDLHVLMTHLSRYPEYPDIVTTKEVAEAAYLHGVDSGHVINSGISNDALTGHVDATLGHLDLAHALHELVPEVAFGIIAVFALIKLRAGEDKHDVMAWVKEQAALAGIANLAGLLVQVVTGTSLLRPVTAIGTRLMAARGKLASQVADRMVASHAVLRQLLASRHLDPETA